MIKHSYQLDDKTKIIAERRIFMKLSEVKEILNAKVLTGEEFMDKEVNSACGCDLMSDVLAFVKDKALLLTGQIGRAHV